MSKLPKLSPLNYAGCKAFLVKWVLFAWERKITFISMASHLALLWNRGLGQLKKWCITQGSYTCKTFCGKISLPPEYCQMHQGSNQSLVKMVARKRRIAVRERVKILMRKNHPLPRRNGWCWKEILDSPIMKWKSNQIRSNNDSFMVFLRIGCCFDMKPLNVQEMMISSW